jgi:hypothetical protein
MPSNSIAEVLQNMSYFLYIHYAHKLAQFAVLTYIVVCFLPLLRDPQYCPKESHNLVQTV